MLTWREGDAVALRVQESADLNEIALALYLILDGVGFHQVGVVPVRLQDPLDAFVVALGEDRRLLGLHEGGHAGVGRDLGVLSEIKVLQEKCLTQ